MGRCRWMTSKAPSRPCDLGFDALMKGSWCQLPRCRGRLSQGPEQVYSSDQSEQCCTWSRHRTLGIQLQYLKTVGVQRHQPGPQGGHVVTGETRARGRSYWSWTQRTLGHSSSTTCHSSCSRRPSSAGRLCARSPCGGDLNSHDS